MICLLLIKFFCRADPPCFLRFRFNSMRKVSFWCCLLSLWNFLGNLFINLRLWIIKWSWFYRFSFLIWLLLLIGWNIHFIYNAWWKHCIHSVVIRKVVFSQKLKISNSWSLFICYFLIYYHLFIIAWSVLCYNFIDIKLIIILYNSLLFL